MSNKILIVEDEERLALLLKDYLVKAGFTVDILNDGELVAGYVSDKQPDLILLDLMLPGKDGLTVIRELRAVSRIPVIMITARVEEIDRLLGLELGADDYICKPFSFREVVARVKAVFRRVSPEDKTDASENIKFDESRQDVILFGKHLELTAIEFQLFKAMADQPGRIFTRDRLMDHIYSDGRIVSDRTIDSHIRKLRKKINDLHPGLELIVSVYSVGYKFEIPLKKDC